jgi:hypothetical protein
MFFGGFKLQPEKITTRKKKGTVVWSTVEINLTDNQPSVVSKYKHQLLQNWKKIMTRKKRHSRLVVGSSTKHKTQHTQTQQPTR